MKGWKTVAAAFAGTVAGFLSTGAFGMTFSVPVLTPEAAAWQQMTAPGELRVFGTGPVEERAASDLRAFLKGKAADHVELVLDSPGGSVVGAMRLGEFLRSIGADTSVGKRGKAGSEPGECFGACALAYAGGVGRYLGSGSSIDRPDDSAPGVASYLRKMGVDPGAFGKAGASTRAPGLPGKAATASGLVNNGVLWVRAEVKSRSGVPYVVVRQAVAPWNRMTNNTVLIVGRVPGVSAWLVSMGIVSDPEIARNRYEATQRAVIMAGDAELMVGTKEKTEGRKPEVVLDRDTLWVMGQARDERTRKKIREARDLVVEFDTEGAMAFVGWIDFSRSPEAEKTFIRFLGKELRR